MNILGPFVVRLGRQSDSLMDNPFLINRRVAVGKLRFLDIAGRSPQVRHVPNAIACPQGGEEEFGGSPTLNFASMRPRSPD